MPVPKGYRKKACKRGHVDFPRYKNNACAICRKITYKEQYAREKEYRVQYAIRRAQLNPEARRDEQRAYRLGVPVAQVRAAIAACGGKCQSCEIPLTHRKMCIDHDHATGRIRGVLCVFCNALEGMLNKQKTRTEKLLAYLKKDIDGVSK
jgi:hypothetical protein